MQKPNQQRAPKWPITVPLLFFILIVMITTLPVILPLTLLLSLVPGYRGATRTLLFLLCYLVCEVVGVVASAWITLRYPRSGKHFQTANFKLQCWWASALWKSARRIFSLSFHTHGRGSAWLGCDLVASPHKYCRHYFTDGVLRHPARLSSALRT